LTVDRIVVEGQTFQTEAREVFSVGTFSGPNMISGFGLGETLYSNGRFTFGQNPIVGSQLSVFALGIRGEERFNVVIGDEVVSTFSTENQVRGLTQYAVQLDRVIDASEVRIEFINDLYIPEQGIDPAVFSSGVYVPGVGITEGFLQSETLHANGFFQFANSNDTIPPVVTIANPIGVITSPTDQPIIDLVIEDETPQFPVETAISVVFSKSSVAQVQTAACLSRFS